MMHWRSFAAACRSSARTLPGTVLLAYSALAGAAAPPQQDPELRSVVQQAISEAQCFADKYDSAVWFTLMEPKLRRYVKDKDERLQILQTVFRTARMPRCCRLAWSWRCWMSKADSITGRFPAPAPSD
jgi:hypothetical protein